jgi:alpha-glucosidase (family GH31 glycosyl hydrolase)
MELKAGSTVTWPAAPVPLAVAARSTSIVRLEIGPPGARALSFLPEGGTEGTAPVAVPRAVAAPTALETGAMVLSLAADPARVEFASPAGGVHLRFPLAEVRLAPQPRVRFEFVGEQHFYGLGESAPPFDRLGASRRLWTKHVSRGYGSDISIPLLLSHRGYALFFDNSSAASVDVGRSDGGFWIEYACDKGPLIVYYLTGAGPRDVLGEAAALLGRAPMPPRWALGYMQSSRHFQGRDELRRLGETLREKRLPCDTLIFLSTYGEAKGWNSAVGRLECEPGLIPEPEVFFGDLRRCHFHVMTHEYPVLHPESPLFPEAASHKYLVDAGYAQAPPASRPPAFYQEGQRYLDFSQPEVREWWWRAHRDLVRWGVEAWWLDGGEGPPSGSTLRGGSGAVLHNRYDVLRMQAFADGEAADRPGGRVYLLCRSGGPGMQRYGGACWSGDINNTFATFEAQVPAGLSIAMSGVPYWGTDIGGFFHPVPESPELFARWFQFGAFCPVFRAHGWVWRDHVPWAHGPEVEEICRRYLELRYRLMPYTYTLAWQAHRLGLPLMRPLVLNYPDDPRVWDLGGQYLWGDDLLVAPVTRAGATQWPVYLPAGTWFDFWTHERFEGGQGIGAHAPLDRLPLFVREGAIIPTGPAMQYHDERPLDDVTLLVYPGPRSSFTLYEDDGATRAYEKGRYALTEFDCTRGAGSVTLRLAAPVGDAAVIPAGRTYTLQVHMPKPPRSVTLDRRAEPARPSPGAADGWWHEAQFLFVRVPRTPVSVTISW